MTLQDPNTRVPASPAALPPLHPGDGGARLRNPEGKVRGGGRGVLLRLGSGEDRHDFLRAAAQSVDQWRAADSGAVHAAARARQCRSARRRRGGAARPLERAGRHRHGDALSHAARLSGDAAAGPPPDAGGIPRSDHADERLLGEHAQVHRQPAEGVVGRRGDGGERLRIRLSAEARDGRRLLASALHGGDARGHRAGIHLPGSEPGRGQPEREDGSGGDAQPEMARRGGPVRDRNGAGVEGAGRRSGKLSDRGLLLPGRAGRRKGRLADQHDAARAVASARGRAAGRCPLRRRLHRRSRQPAEAAVRGLDGAKGSTDPRSCLGLPGRRARSRSPTWSWCCARSTASPRATSPPRTAGPRTERASTSPRSPTSPTTARPHAATGS